MRVWLGLSPNAPRGHTHRTPSDPKAILLESLQEAFIRKFSISIPNLFIAHTSISSGIKDTK